MCGIVGVIGSPARGASAYVRRGLNLIVHRGPDDTGLIEVGDNLATLGHVRLSVIDTSSAGHQPMCINDRYHLVFNGEIYNHREIRSELESLGECFFSSSDSEVVLRAYERWGESCVERFIGMFAFVIHDEHSHVCFAARDRAGEKPFFFSRVNGALYFASEVKSLLVFPQISCRLDVDSLHHYLAFGRSPNDQSLVEGVQKLPPGHVLSFDAQERSFHVRPYWQVPRFQQEHESEYELVNDLEQRLEDAVATQLVADVPLGVLLSGGVDSSLVTALGARRADKLRTFTLTFPDHPEQCEAGHADLIARHFGTVHTELEVREPSVELLARLAYQYDDPIADSSMIPTFLVTEAISRHCKVALGGDGGDELFGGYVSYNFRLKFAERLRHVPTVISKCLGNMALRMTPVGRRGRGLARMLNMGIDPQLWPIGYMFNASERVRLLREGLHSDVPEFRHHARALKSGLGISGMTRTDFSGYLVDDLLVKVDRASMLNSLEVRAPFLDHRIIEFAFRNVPDDSKATHTERKRLLKLLCSRVLPNEFDFDRKQGFSVPYLEWLKRPSWYRFFRETLLDCGSPIFDRKEMEKYLKAGARDGSVAPQLFGLVMLERWRAAYGITL